MLKDPSSKLDSNVPSSLDGQQIETVKSNNGLNIILWIIGVGFLLAATLVNQYLPQYWALGNQIGWRIAATLACILLGIAILYATQQGRGFSRLLRDSRIELKRVTWPIKQETVSTSWQVLVVIIIASLILWAFDFIMQFLVGLITG